MGEPNNGADDNQRYEKNSERKAAEGGRDAPRKIAFSGGFVVEAALGTDVAEALVFGFTIATLCHDYFPGSITVGF